MDNLQSKILKSCNPAIVAVCFVLGTFLFITACHRPIEPVRLKGEAQGTYYSIIYYDSLNRNLQPKIDSLLHSFDMSASLWIDSSLLRCINNNTKTALDNTLLTLLQQSLYINQYTQGAFDCTVGKLVRAWGFGFDKRANMTDAIIDSLRQYTGPNCISIDSSSGNYQIVKQHPETEIDFNAIAQGYSVDLIGAYFENLGINNYLVDVGGEVIAHGGKPDGTPWSVGLEKPAENKYSAPEVETAIALQNPSVVTSGNYRKYYEKNGVKDSHTIDPSTGRPVEHSLLSVSVVDKYAWRADALATSFMVMGLQKSLRFIKDHPNDLQVQKVYFIYNEQGKMKTYATEEFKKLITEKDK